jgi:uncharacterized protein (DUF1778 family)
MLIKNKYIHIRITEKKKKEIQEIAKKLNKSVTDILIESIDKIIDKNYTLLD